MTDKRNRCKANPPHKIGKRPVTVHLDPVDYRQLYELTMQRGVSMADTIRQIIRETKP
ncbi:ribbon-helix-helix domain-containing protein [Roseovarius indicus]|uniref:ribbon-helix-helix domain-containing protein n=1 Tax=Roseovarius indicus TaxID=540747 RepID=UPI000AF355F0|nr:ribbon-helix-helix domain-containing protein [Roseovarius indicus]